MAQKKPSKRFVINLDMRDSFVKNSPITIYGAYVGLRYNQKHQYTIGYYTLSATSQQTIKEKNTQLKTPITDNVNFGFVSLGYTRTIYTSKLLKVDIPAEIGIGEASVGAYNQNGDLLKLTNGMAIPIQLGGSVMVNITPWLGIHLQAGHREIIGKTIFNNQYSGIYYTYGLSFNFGKIYRGLKGN